MENLDSKSDSSSDSSIDLDEPANASTAGNAAYIPGVSLSDKLRLAASKGQSDKLKDLLSLGASFEPDREGRTAIHYSAVNGFAQTVLHLIVLGCDINSQDKTGYTAIHRAAAQGHLEVIKALAGSGCWLDSQDEIHGNTALHEAAWNGYSQTLEVLVMNGANVHLLNKSGFSALHMSAQNGHNNSARILLYAGCNPLQKNNYGDTPLHTAARYGHAGIARILISARCNINDQNKNADTALHISAALKRRKITKLLLDAGVMTAILNRQGETALEVAQRKEYHEIVQMLVSYIKSKQHEQPDVKRIEDNSGAKPVQSLALVPPATNAGEGPQQQQQQLTEDDEKKKKKKGFFFKKKKKAKDKEIATDPNPPPLKSGPLSNGGGIANRLPTPEELMLGFQRYQAYKQQQQMPPQQQQQKMPPPQQQQQHITGPEHLPSGNNYEPLRSGIQCYMDLAGNIRQGPVCYGPGGCSCSNSFDRLNSERPLNSGSIGLNLHNQFEVGNRRIQLQQQTTTMADAERRRFQDWKNVNCDNVSSLEQRVRRQFNMQKAFQLNTQQQQQQQQQQQLLDLQFAGHACTCEWCHGNTKRQPHGCHGDSNLLLDRRHGKCIPETPPPGKMYKSKSDETLSTLSSHANKRNWVLEEGGGRGREQPDVRSKRCHRRLKEQPQHRGEKRCENHPGKGRDPPPPPLPRRAQTPDGLLNEGRGCGGGGGELNENSTLIVPANVREWLAKQEDTERNVKFSNPMMKVKYTEIYDL